MNPTPQLKYQVSEMIFDAKSCLDEENFYHQRQGLPSELTKKMTYILGDYNKNYPISTMTLGGVGYGAGSKGAVELDDVQFTYPVMGRSQKANIVAKSLYSAGDKPGVGNSAFKLYFTDNWIKRFFVIHSGNGTQARVQKDLELVGGLYEATCELSAATAVDFCPLADTDIGASWIALFAPVSESLSRSTETAMAMPGIYKNQMSFIRAGMSWAGNAANKVMRIEVQNPTSGKSTNVWMDYFMWQFENEWLSQSEHLFWYSRYNRLANGQVPLKDLLSQKTIPIGSGIFEQIQNKSSYSRLSYDFLSGIVSDASFSRIDQVSKMKTFVTGKGGLREADRAIAEKGLARIGSFANIGDKFITGSGGNLMLGGYFDGFTTIDGEIVKFKHNPIFDSGRVALAQQAAGMVHPETGWPLESYRMCLLDDSDYDGQPNIQHVSQKGRSYLHGVVAGLTPMPRSLQAMSGSFPTDGGQNAVSLATDLDQSSYTRFKSAGIQILNASNCFDLICTAGL